VVSSPKIMLTSFDPTDMQEVTDLFAQIRQHRPDSETLAKEFDGYVWTVMESLGQQLGRDLSQTEKKIEVLKSKFFLIDVCFEKAVDSLNHSKSDASMLSIFSELRNLICTSFVTMSQ
jgi:hypothetical protein